MPSVTRIWARCVAHSYQRTADLLIVDFTDQTADLLCWCITWKLLKKKKKRVTLEVIITWGRLCGRGQSQMRGNTKQIQNSRYILNDYNKSTSSKCRIAVQMIETEIKAMHVFAQSCLLVGSHIKIMDFITQLCEDCCTCSLISEPLRDQTPWPLLQRSELGQQVISILTRAGSKGVIWCRISVISTHNTPHNRLGCSPDCVFIPLMSRARGNVSAVGQMIYMCSVQMTLQRWCLHQPTGRWVNCTWSSSYFVTNAKLKFDFIIVEKNKKKHICVARFHLVGSVPCRLLANSFFDIRQENSELRPRFSDQEGSELHFSLTVAEHAWAGSICQLGCITAHRTRSAIRLSFS